MIKIPEPMRRPADLFNDEADCFGAPLADATAVEIGKQLGAQARTSWAISGTGQLGMRIPRTVEASTIGRVMREKRRKFDAEFREGAVRLNA
jgi:hypothetical protein